jgi:uncharacterized delta-60 repeat protein
VRDAASVLTTPSRLVLLCALVLVAALAPPGAAPQAGEAGFGNGGWFGLRSSPVGIWPQRDGKILVAVALSGVGLTRLLPDGRPDPSFGKGGFVPGVRRTCTGACERDRAALQPDGAILVAQQATLMRRLADGRLDAGFGAGGRVRLESGQVSGLAVAPDGSIVVAIALDNTGRAALARYLPDGTRDGRFGVGGRRLIGARAPVQVAVQPDGRILVTGHDVALSRYLADGSPDDSFGTHGVVAVDGLSGEALALQPDGKIVVAGLRTGATVVARFLTDGRLDRQFGSDGVTGKEFRYGFPRGLAVLSDGTVAVAGVRSLGPAYKSSQWLAAIVTPDGRWNTLTGPPTCPSDDDDPVWVYEQADAVAVQPDGKVLFGGSSCTGTYIGRFTQSLELDAGPRIRLTVLARRGQLLRGSVDRDVLHVTGALRTSHPASITVSVRDVARAAQCRVRDSLRLLPGSTLGRKRLTRSAWLLHSSTPAGVRTRFDVALPLARLSSGASYGVHLWAVDARQRSDAGRVVFTIAGAERPGSTGFRLDSRVPVCPPE